MPLELTQPAQYVVQVTINNQAKRNAMSQQMMMQLAALWDEPKTSDCPTVMVTGAGDRAFCAGADISGDLSANENTACYINRGLLKDSSFNTFRLRAHCLPALTKNMTIS